MRLLYILNSIWYFIHEWYNINVLKKPRCVYFLTSIEDIKKARYIVLSENNIVCTRHEYAICFTSICNELTVRENNSISEYKEYYGGGEETKQVYVEGFLLAPTMRTIAIANNRNRMFCFPWWVKNYLANHKHDAEHTIAILLPKVYWRRFGMEDKYSLWQ